MKNSKLLLIAILIIPWLTIPLLGRNAFKKYLPASIFIYICTKIIAIMGERKKWWRFYKGIVPLNSADFVMLGPYYVASFWMLKMTYGKFLTYLISNNILHILYTLVGLKFLGRFRIFSLVKYTKFQYFGVLFLRALLLYAFQFILDMLNKYIFTNQHKCQLSKDKY